MIKNLFLIAAVSLTLAACSAEPETNKTNSSTTAPVPAATATPAPVTTPVTTPSPSATASPTATRTPGQ